jgi:guanylate kinase
MKPKLQHKQEFEEILHNYQPSAVHAELLGSAAVTLLVGPSSAGRNRIIKELLKTGSYHQIVSDTTRPPRSNDGVMEQNGHEYWFKTEQEMLDELKSGDLLEAAVIHDQQVSGVSIRELKIAHEAGKVAVNDIEVAGARYAKQRIAKAKLIFVLPPNFETWMQRLDARGNMSEDEKRTRLATAVREIERMEREIGDYHVVVNDELSETVTKVRQISEYDNEFSYENSHEQQVARQLIAGIHTYLN